ncbi:transcription termination factor MTEF18, mitochondrial-like [Carex rostrata]
MCMTLFLGRISCLRPSLPLNQTTPFASSNAPTQPSPPNAQFAVHYLVESCGLSSDEALKASKYIHRLKSPDKPDAALRFLRDTGVSESDIKTAVLRHAGILCSHVEKNWRPNIAKLQEVGFSMEDISGIISVNPDLFGFNFVSKIDFWMEVLGSVENLSVVLKVWRGGLIARSLEKVIMPNLSFLQENCGLSTRQIVRVIKSSPKLLTSKPEFVKRVPERVEELGIARSSGSFCSALIAVSCMSERTIDAKLNNLRNIGFSQEEVTLLISKAPLLLKISEKSMGRKMEFLMKEAGCDKLHVIRNPFLFNCGLENRLIPRNLVRKLLMSKGLPVANLKFASFARPSDENFVEKFILPNEHAIPGLHRAYADASAGKIEGVEFFNNSIYS